MEILELLLQKLDKYLDDETITEFSIIKDGEIRCRKFSGERMTIFDENIDRQYLQSLVRIIATKQNRNITDIDNFSEELQLSYKGNIHRISTEFGGLRQDGFVFTIRLKRNYNICFEDFQMDKKTKNIILDSLKNKNSLNFNWLVKSFKMSNESLDFFNKNDFFNLLAGTDKIMNLIKGGANSDQIRETYQIDLQKFKLIRKKYLIYDDFE